ncbi:MAG: DUF1036 domain-containing protein [Hyphomicrobiaceae bacterium]|nr:DUF1036 domain-containing protein [Hyphomicrobiaceae bacterium]
MAVIFLLASGAPALADLKICNATSSRIGVAIGYRDTKGWATEGWWNIPPQTCETLLKGILASRFYYIHAIDYDRSGEWAGKNVMCTASRSFLLRQVRECEKYGYKSAGFFEVDTGDQRDWTVQLSDQPTQGGKGR